MKKTLLWISAALNVILIILLCLSLHKLSCSHKYPYRFSKKEIRKDPVESLEEYERKGLHILVDAYDRFVFDNTDPALPVEDAYYRFFEENGPKIMSAGETGCYFVPGPEYFELVPMAVIDPEPFRLPYVRSWQLGKINTNIYPERVPYVLDPNIDVWDPFLYRVARQNDFWAEIAECWMFHVLLPQPWFPG